LLLMLSTATAALFLLAVSLSNTVLAPSQPVSVEVGFGRAGPTGQAGASEWISAILRVFVSISLICLPVVLVIAMLKRHLRRQIIWFLVITAGLLLLARRAKRSAFEFPRIGPAAITPKKVAEAAKPTAHATTSVSWAWVFLIATAICLVLAALAVRRVRQRSTAPAELNNNPDLATHADAAVDALRSGQAVDETIQRCYLDMCEVLQRERSIERRSSMTPHEFQLDLERRSLPKDAVRSLTQLFEEIRYGGTLSTQTQQQLAIQCLEEIGEACRKSPGSTSLLSHRTEDLARADT
jgi:hypothetical protein